MTNTWQVLYVPLAYYGEEDQVKMILILIIQPKALCVQIIFCTQGKRSSRKLSAWNVSKNGVNLKTN